MLNSSSKAARSVLAIAALGLALPTVAAIGSPAAAATRPAAQAYHFSNAVTPESDHRLTFETKNDPLDPTFNQLLGINNDGKIAGYFGIGSAIHPNKGYTLSAPYGNHDYMNENFPGSVQTQVTAINNRHETAGFWVDGNGNNFGFIESKGLFWSYRDPHTGTGTVNQILGLSDNGIAVGFYTDGQGMNHGFALNQANGKFFKIVPPGGSNVTASAINGSNDVTGFMTNSSGAVVGYLLKNNKFFQFAFPNATSTTPFGINDNDKIVGSYVDQAGKTHGFIFKNGRFSSVDDPNGIGTTVVNGCNDKGELVGFYVDGAGNTDGFIAK